MAVTLAQAKVGMADKVDQSVIDELRRGSFVLDSLVFDDAVSPGTGGSTLVYGYQRLKTPSLSGFRAINSEYQAGEAEREEKVAKLAILGGSFQIDRVLCESSSKALDELQFQLQQKVKSAVNAFHYNLVMGDTANDANGFDGLNKALKGSTSELNGDVVIDISTQAKLAENKDALMEAMDSIIAEIDGEASAILVNKDMKIKLNSLARATGYYTRGEDAFGKGVDMFAGIPIVDMGNYAYEEGGTVKTKSVVPTEGRTVNAVAQTGLTDIYVVKFGLDALHGASLAGGKVVKTYLPDLETPGAVKTGEVELIGTPVLKSTAGAVVLRNVKIK